MTRRRVWGLLRAALGLALLALAVWRVDWAQIGSLLRGVHPAWALAALASVLLSLGLKVVRWGVILWAFETPPHWLRLSGAFFLGQAANLLVPVRGGDVLRVAWVSASGEPGLAVSASSLLVEKLLDFFALTGLILLLGPFVPINTIQQSRAWLLPLTIGLALALLTVLWVFPRVWPSIFPRLPRWLRSPAGALDDLIRRSAWLRNPRKVGLLAGITVVTWGIMAATNLLALRSLDLPVDVRAAGLVLALVYAGQIPATISGNLGAFYFFAQLALMPFGVELQQRAAFAVLLHALVNLPPLVLGGVALLVDRSRRGGAQANDRPGQGAA